jgi:hypothetical protein
MEPDWENLNSTIQTKTSSGILDVDSGMDSRDATTRLKFIQNVLSKQPYIQNSHGTDFAELTGSITASIRTFL